jgi:hypothetical protein
LQRTLHKLPSDLEEYFEHILSSDIDLDKYRSETAHMFLVTLAAFDNLPLMSYWFMDQMGSELEVKLEVKPMTVQQVRKRLANMEKRISACCKGLLEVRFFDSDNHNDSSLSSSVLFNWKVDFLHRTVRDFLIKPSVRVKQEEWAGCDFDPNLSICKAIISQIRTAPPQKIYFEEGGPIWKLITIFRYHVERLTFNKSGSSTALLQSELETLLFSMKL